jgi:hypothetical protein
MVKSNRYIQYRNWLNEKLQPEKTKQKIITFMKEKADVLGGGAIVLLIVILLLSVGENKPPIEVKNIAAKVPEIDTIITEFKSVKTYHDKAVMGTSVDEKVRNEAIDVTSLIDFTPINYLVWDKNQLDRYVHTSLKQSIAYVKIKGYLYGTQSFLDGGMEAIIEEGIEVFQVEGVMLNKEQREYLLYQCAESTNIKYRCYADIYVMIKNEARLGGHKGKLRLVLLGADILDEDKS